MSEPDPRGSGPDGAPERATTAAVAALAATGIVLEVALVRVLSALLSGAWVAPVLAAALLGGGLGAASIALRPGWAARGPAALAAALAAAGAALLPLAWTAATAASAPLWALAPTVAVHALAGGALAAAFAARRERAAALYRADLAAAATAAAVVPLLLTSLGTGAAAHATGVGFALAAALLAPAAWRLPAAAAGLPALLLAAATASGALELDAARTVAAKPLRSLAEAGGVVEHSVWDATARVDLVRAPDGARYVFLDGGAGSLVPGPDPARWRGDVGALAFAIGADAPATGAAAPRPRRALAIGTGGGLDVAQARAAGIADVTAIEVARAAVALVRDLGSASGGVYAAPTRVVVGDGRRELARLAARGEGPWDVITLAQVVLQAAEADGAARTEQRLYTREAFAAALRALTPDGHLALKLYDEVTLSRALTTGLAALVDAGLAATTAEAVAHVFVALDAGATPPVPLLVVRRAPFDVASAVAAARAAERGGWSLVVVPGLLAPPALEALAAGALDLEGFAAQAGGDLDVRPTRDARPYFFDVAPGWPPGSGAVAALGAAALAAVGLLSWRSARARGRPADADPPARRAAGARVATAGALGGAFLLAELAALEVVRAAVGHPTTALAVTLAAVLLGAALGAHGVARRRAAGAARAGSLARAALAAAATAALVPWVGPAWVAIGAAWAPLPATLAAAALVGAAAVTWGRPFPGLLHAAVDRGEVAAHWAASGAGAVVAAALAALLAPTLGLPAVAAAGALAYALAAASALAASAPSDPAAGATRASRTQASAQAVTASSSSGSA